MVDRDRCRRFAKALGRLVAADDSDRKSEVAILAHLRRGSGKPFGYAPTRDGWVLNVLDGLREGVPPIEDWSEQDIEWACTIASLFAGHRGSSNDRFGSAYRKLWQRRGEADSVSRRFAILIDADVMDLATQLRHAIALMKAEDIAPDWGRLMFDLVRWSDPTRSVQRRWSRDFWLDTPRKKTRAASSHK